MRTYTTKKSRCEAEPEGGEEKEEEEDKEIEKKEEDHNRKKKTMIKIERKKGRNTELKGKRKGKKI